MVRGQRHAPAAHYPGKNTVPIIQEAGWAPGPFWTGAENLAPTGIRSPDRPVRSQSLYQLSYRDLLVNVVGEKKSLLCREFHTIYKNSTHSLFTVLTELFLKQYNIRRTPLIRTLVTWNANYPDRLGPSVKFVENSKKLTCPEITGYRTKYSSVLWLLELQIRRGRKVQAQVHSANSNSRNSNSQCSLFSQKNSIVWIFRISGFFAVPIILYTGQWNSTVVKCLEVNKVLKIFGFLGQLVDFTSSLA